MPLLRRYPRAFLKKGLGSFTSGKGDRVTNPATVGMQLSRHIANKHGVSEASTVLSPIIMEPPNAGYPFRYEHLTFVNKLNS